MNRSFKFKKIKEKSSNRQKGRKFPPGIEISTAESNENSRSKSTDVQVKNQLDRLNIAEEKINKLEDKSMKISRLKDREEKE